MLLSLSPEPVAVRVRGCGATSLVPRRRSPLQQLRPEKAARPRRTPGRIGQAGRRVVAGEGQAQLLAPSAGSASHGQGRAARGAPFVVHEPPELGARMGGLVVLPPPARSSAGRGAYGNSAARTGRLRPGDLPQTRARLRRSAWCVEDSISSRIGGACCARVEEVGVARRWRRPGRVRRGAALAGASLCCTLLGPARGRGSRGRRTLAAARGGARLCTADARHRSCAGGGSSPAASPGPGG
jgi:hypothetical protein